MKIALVVHDLHERGGHSLYTRILADELASRHAVTVFANVCERPATARWNFVPVRAWRTNALATVHTFPLGLRSAGPQLAEFEIRHMQGYCGGDPNVVTAHICLSAYLNSLKDISTQTKTSLRLMAAAEARFYRRYQGHIIAISQQVARELQEFYKLPNPISVIPHGVDTNRFSTPRRAQHREPARRELNIIDATMALYVGDLTKAHSHLKAITAAAPEIEFVIVTASTQYHWPARNVHFVPATPELERYYAAADAFIFPTTYDAFGMVLLEAMASGLAVFSSDRAGAGELISSGKDGFVIPLDEWVETTRQGLRELDLLRRVGAAAEITAQQHGWPRVVREVEQLYFKLVAAPAGSAAPTIADNGYRYQQ